MEVTKRRWAPWSGGVLLVLFGVLGILDLGPGRTFVFGDDPPTAPKSIPAVPDSTQVAPPATRDPALEEILRLRRAIGGAATKDVLDEKQFAEALRKLAQNTTADTAPPAPDATVPAPFNSDDSSAGINTLPPPSLPELPIETLPSADPTASPESLDQHLIDTLRTISRELDSRASDLDDQRRYATADRIRKLAQRMRTELRQLESSPEYSNR